MGDPGASLSAARPFYAKLRLALIASYALIAASLCGAAVAYVLQDRSDRLDEATRTSSILARALDKHVRAVVALAHAFGVKIVAESVESKDDELERLRELGCDEYQGFLFSAAVPPAELEKLATR